MASHPKRSRHADPDTAVVYSARCCELARLLRRRVATAAHPRWHEPSWRRNLTTALAETEAEQKRLGLGFADFAMLCDIVYLLPEVPEIVVEIETCGLDPTKLRYDGHCWTVVAADEYEATPRRPIAARAWFGNAGYRVERRTTWRVDEAAHHLTPLSISENITRLRRRADEQPRQ